jgi:flavoprotein
VSQTFGRVWRQSGNESNFRNFKNIRLNKFEFLFVNQMIGNKISKVGLKYAKNYETLIINALLYREKPL